MGHRQLADDEADAKNLFEALRRRADDLGLLLLTEVGPTCEGTYRAPYTVYTWDASPSVRLRRLRRAMCAALRATARPEMALELEHALAS